MHLMNKLIIYPFLIFTLFSCSYSDNKITKSSIVSDTSFLCYEDGRFNAMPFDIKGCESPTSSAPLSTYVRDVKVKDGKLFVLTNRSLSITQNDGQTWVNRGRYTENFGLETLGTYREPLGIKPGSNIFFDLDENIYFSSSTSHHPLSWYLTSTDNGENFDYVLNDNFDTVSLESTRAQIEALALSRDLRTEYAFLDPLTHIPVNIDHNPETINATKKGNTILAFNYALMHDDDTGDFLISTLLAKSTDNGASYQLTELSNISAYDMVCTGIEAFCLQAQTFVTNNLKIIARSPDIPGKIFVSDTNQENFQEFISVNFPTYHHLNMIMDGNDLIYFNNGSIFQLNTETLVETTLITDPALSGISITKLYRDGSTLYIGHSQGLFKLQDNTLTEIIAPTPYPTDIQRALSVGNKLYLATKNGLYISTDLAQSFTVKTTADGLGSNFVNTVIEGAGRLIVGTSNGISISSDNGESFTNYETGSTANEKDVISLLVNQNTVFVGTKLGLFTSSLDNINFTKLNFATNGFPELAHWSYVNC
jgi:hypothetical protein